MKTVKIRDVEIGTGIPKVCVPIVEKTRKEIEKAAKSLLEVKPDLVEWRADWYQDVMDDEEVKETLCALRDILGDIPILFTFRTLKEGGEKDISSEAYERLNRKISESRYADMIDVELFSGDEVVDKLIETAHSCGLKVIVSNHDFEETPEKEEMVKRLCRMQELGADILKIAVMPQSRKDVLTLLETTEEMTRLYAKRPLVTMSMGADGVISRISGELFGSAMTFGTFEKSSAPGQIDVFELKRILQILHGE